MTLIHVRDCFLTPIISFSKFSYRIKYLDISYQMNALLFSDIFDYTHRHRHTHACTHTDTHIQTHSVTKLHSLERFLCRLCMIHLRFRRLVAANFFQIILIQIILQLQYRGLSVSKIPSHKCLNVYYFLEQVTPRQGKIKHFGGVASPASVSNSLKRVPTKWQQKTTDYYGNFIKIQIFYQKVLHFCLHFLLLAPFL